MHTVTIVPCGDSALLVEFENIIAEEVQAKVSVLTKLVEEARLHGVRELIPTYRSLMLCYDPIEMDYETLYTQVEKLLGKIDGKKKREKKIVTIPVCYGGEYGPDLDFVAEYSGLSAEQVIKFHTKPDYLIYMLGFTPGFPYLGGMDKRIAAPRLEAPRTRLAAGSVGIAGEQTGLYPLESPGGWRIIGRTPLKLYDPERENPILLQASQYIKFKRISEEEFLEIQKQVEDRTYDYHIERL